MKFQKVSFEQFKKDIEACRLMWIFANDEEILRGTYDGIQLPRRATSGSAGYDFFLPFGIHMQAGAALTIPTGIRAEIDGGYCLLCIPRSGLGFKFGTRLTNTIGCIDEDYYHADNEGHIMAKMTCDREFSLSAGDRFMQGIFVMYGMTNDDDPADSKRIGGFGSTGGS